MKKNYMLLLVVFVTTCFGIVLSYNMSVSSGVLLFLENDFLLAPEIKKHVVSTVVLGAVLGVILGGVLSDRLGRKKAWILASFICLVGGIFSIVASSIEVLLVARFLAGVGIGLSSVIIPIYLSEISPPKYRGAIVSSFQLAITVGILIAYFTNWIVSKTQNWRLSFAVGGGFALVGTLGLLFLPDSSSRFSEKGTKQGFMSMALLIGVGLATFQQITGINTVIYYGPLIFSELGFSNLTGKLAATLGIGVINVLATIIAMRYVDRSGRRSLLLIGLGGMAVSLALLAIFIKVTFFAAFCLALYVIFFAMSLGPVLWVVISEIFPTETRGRGISLSLFINWIFTYLIAFSFLGMMEKMGLPLVFTLFGGISLLALAFVYFLVPETKGKTLEEIQLYWKK